MTKFKVIIEQNGGEYIGWMTFHADDVQQKSDRVLLVDGKEMEFDEDVEFREVKE